MSDIPLKPLSREEIRRLETALLVMSLFSQETLEAVKDPHERLTWVDSLYVAAAALARERAGMPVSRIAEEVGVTEATVRRHLRGETKAGQLVQRTFEKLSREGFRVELPPIVTEEVEALRRENEVLKAKLEEVRNTLRQLLDKL